MSSISFRQLMAACALLTPFFAHAGGIEIIEAAPCCEIIPNMVSGWGFHVQGAILRPYNNDLIYGVNGNSEFFEGTLGDDDLSESFYTNNYKSLKPKYAFNLQVGLNYNFYDSGTVLQLYYEHFFNRKVTDSSSSQLTTEIPDLFGEFTLHYFNQGSLRNKFDGITLSAEQHFILGPFWESTLTGGLRFAHLSQEVQLYNNILMEEVRENTGVAYNSMQFNGVGPLAGIGTLFHLNEDFAIGAEALGALLMGRNKISNNVTSYIDTIDGDSLTNTYVTNNIEPIYSMVPELYYRIYGNYSYLFANNTELTVELGWRGNHFFNVRTGIILNQPFEGNTNFDPNFTTLEQAPTTSNDIGFSGPYLTLYYQI